MKDIQTLSRLAVLLLILGVVPAYAQFTPSDDAYTNTASPSSNFGAKTLLDVQSSTQTSYILFDLSPLPAGYTGANISKASLKLYVNSVTAAGSFNVDLVNGSWTEKTITANLSPALGGTVAASIPLAGSNAKDYVIVDVTSAVQAWLNGSQPNDGLALVANSPLNATFDSKESTTQSHPPELDIVFTTGLGTITGVTTASGSGLSGGGTSGTLNLSLATACSANQVLKWNGTVWACSNLSGSGTVTSVGLSAPASDFTVTGSPVTTSGTLGLNWTIPPDSNSTPNSIVKRDAYGSALFEGVTIGDANLTSLTLVNNGGNPVTAYGGGTNQVVIFGQASGSGARGVEGYAADAGSTGVVGYSNAGLSSAGTGVYGDTLNVTGVGVIGRAGLFPSGTGSGLMSLGIGAGVWGDSNSGPFIQGAPPAARAAVVATADGNWALWAENNSPGLATAVINNETSVAGGKETQVLYASGTATGGGRCSFSTLGNFYCSGSKSAVVPVDGSTRQVALYAIEGPENWFEDVGGADLAGGRAVVHLDPTFAQTVNTDMDYRVFLTPNGDCKGLYVSSKTPTSFEVHELGGGTASVSFDYRIIAKRKGFEKIRMEDKTEMMAQPKLPASSGPSSAPLPVVPVEHFPGRAAKATVAHP